MKTIRNCQSLFHIGLCVRISMFSLQTETNITHPPPISLRTMHSRYWTKHWNDWGIWRIYPCIQPDSLPTQNQKLISGIPTIVHFIFRIKRKPADEDQKSEFKVSKLNFLVPYSKRFLNSLSSFSHPLYPVHGSQLSTNQQKCETIVHPVWYHKF